MHNTAGGVHTGLACVQAAQSCGLGSVGSSNAVGALVYQSAAAVGTRRGFSASLWQLLWHIVVFTATTAIACLSVLTRYLQ